MDWTSICIVVVVVVLCIAPTRVAAPPAVVHTVPAHRAGGTPQAARTGTAADPARRKHIIQLWKRATAYILRVLRLRRKWHLLGRHLATHRVQDLVVGLSRRTGTLTRIYDPAFAAVPLAKVRAQPRRRTPAATADSR